ncbi:AI-2E family transporter [Solemya elarraichensis gill symbiont]|uniref:AI-2E family transporter n=1 Tax=Solemya elarraichensis gill symbiont TaxID=1918949 RepID=A0A1T2L994_9GAMM|nr:AI-2E family transporter [Solemya elarraichensis gill symbiont]OOZ41602.1 AI-2E family transporter [Solemya elarraichensis gill symbiont]
MASETRLFWLIIALLGGGLIYLLSPVLAPFIAAAFFAYIGDPLVNKLEVKKSISRNLAVTIVFTITFLILLLLTAVLLPLIENQISALISNMPGYIKWLGTTLVPLLKEYLGFEMEIIDLAEIQRLLSEHWKDAGGILSSLFGQVSRSGFALVGLLVNLLLIPVLTFYLLRDWDSITESIDSLLPLKQQPTIRKLARQSDEMLSAFLRGQLLVMLALGIIYTLGLWMAGLDFALLIGVFAGIVSFVPYLGLILGMLFAVISAILQFKGFDVVHWVALVFIVAQLLEGMILTPKLLGDRIGLHPVAVIFSVMAGGTLYGFYGILLALPVASVLLVLIRYSLQQYRESTFYHGEAEAKAEE